MNGIQVNALGELMPDMFVIELDKRCMVSDTDIILTRDSLIALRDEMTKLLGVNK